MASYFLFYFVVVCSTLPFFTLGKTNIRLQPNTAGSGVFGIINVKHNGKWGTVCNDLWDMKDTFVACRQLGFDRGVGILRYGKGKGQVFLNEMECKGLEKSLEDCSHSDWGKSSRDCNTHKYDIGVVCSSHTGPKKKNMTLQLQPGTEGFGVVGILQVYHENQWGTVCHYPLTWDITATTVACRQLGFDKAEGYWYEAKRDGIAWMNDVRCTGQETSLEKCPHKIVKQDDATCKDRRYDVGIVCSGVKSNVQLVGGTDKNEGRIQVKLEGTWGTVCGDYGWTIENSNVICRMLGHERAIKNQKFGEGNKPQPIWLQEVSCKGCEMSLAECQTTNYSLPNCNHTNDAGVVCLPRGEANIAVRLGDKDANLVSRVEVRYHGIWRSICTNNWDIRDAHVICRMIGYQKAAVAMTTRKGSHGRVWLDYLHCSGNETTIQDCKNVNFTWNWENKPCSNDLRAGVKCFKEKMKLRFHILEGEYAGKLEVQSNRTRGNLCMDNLNLNAANVICRMLGYREAVTVSSWVQQSTAGPNYSLSQRCTGSEHSTDECADVTLNRVDRCNNSEVAGIVCKQADTDYDGKEKLRLVGGSGEHEGRVEFESHGVWGTVCSAGWDMLDANVVCRMKGYKGAITAYKKFPEGTGPIWLAGLNCKGDENSTVDCNHDELDKTMSCSHKDDVGVVCYSEKGYLQVSLEMDNSSSLYEGRIKIKVNNETGTIDDKQWDIQDAHVICRMLKLSKAIAAFSLLREEPDNVLFSGVRCNGTEESLEMCDHGGWGGSTRDHHGYDAGVICARPYAVAQAKMMECNGNNDGAVTGLSILIVVLILIIVGACLWYFFKLRKDKNKDSDKTRGVQLESQGSDQGMRHSRGKNLRNAQESEKSSMI